jgi:adiponectin receptor
MFLTVPLYLGMGASYLLGLTIYAVRCPERYRPGHYDICGHSHQIWHLAVVVGIVLAYIATIINYYQRQLYPTCSLN